MKRGQSVKALHDFQVAPRAGAWIETLKTERPDQLRAVAPRAGAWIETGSVGADSPVSSVAPRAGAWIETTKIKEAEKIYRGRPPRGGVD